MSRYFEKEVSESYNEESAENSELRPNPIGKFGLHKSAGRLSLRELTKNYEYLNSHSNMSNVEEARECGDTGSDDGDVLESQIDDFYNAEWEFADSESVIENINVDYLESDDDPETEPAEKLEDFRSLRNLTKADYHVEKEISIDVSLPTDEFLKRPGTTPVLGIQKPGKRHF